MSSAVKLVESGESSPIKSSPTPLRLPTHQQKKQPGRNTRQEQQQLQRRPLTHQQQRKPD